MKRMTLSFHLHGYWHCGSGEAGTSDLDAAVIRDAEGLQYLPGRSVKGLLREAFRLAEDFGHQPEGATDRLFGSEARPGDPRGIQPRAPALHRRENR
jgi:CRISPR/Cas system CMR subunit Cmr4 (Cas7 group RAMP superfamily)